MNLTQKDRELLASSTYREFLKTELNNRQEKNPRYTLRAMARDLKIPPSSLSTRIRGPLHFNSITVDRITKNLQKPAPIADFFKHLALAESRDPGNFLNPHYVMAREIRLQYLYTPSDAPHRLIESDPLKKLTLTLLLRVEGELKTDANLCQRLKVSPEALKKMIDELLALGWVERSSKGPKSCIRFMELGNKGEAYHVRNIHRSILKQAHESLDSLPMDSRSFYSS